MPVVYYISNVGRAVEEQADNKNMKAMKTEPIDANQAVAASLEAVAKRYKVDMQYISIMDSSMRRKDAGSTLWAEFRIYVPQVGVPRVQTGVVKGAFPNFDDMPAVFDFYALEF